MEAAFANLEKEGKNDVDNLVKWMKESKAINETKEQEEKARAYFNEVNDKQKVKVGEFQNVLKKISDEFKTNLDGLQKQLADFGPQFLQSVTAGATSTLASVGGAIQNALK